MKKKVVIILAEGFEEVEAVAPIDLLRRANLEVTIAGLTSTTVTGAHGITLIADTTVAQIHLQPFDAILLPGGIPGTTNLLASDLVLEMTNRHFRENCIVAAICAAPQVLDQSGALNGTDFTCYPGIETKIRHGRFTNEPVVTSGRVITARSAANSLDFALAVIESLCGKSTAEEVKSRIVFA